MRPATGAQVSYLRRLLIEAFAHHYSDRVAPYDYNHLNGLTMSEASTAIEHLKAAKARGWIMLQPTVEQIAAETARSEATAIRVAKIRELRAQGFRCNCRQQEDETDDSDPSKCDLHSRMQP